MTLTYRAEIVAAAGKYAIDPDLLQAIAERESGYRPWAYNPEPRYRYLWDVKRGKPFRPLTELELLSKFPPKDFPAPPDTDPDQEFWAQQASWGMCVAEGTPIATADGWTPIEQLKAGSIVLDRNGHLSCVLATTRRTAPCLDVRLGLNLPLRVTAEHRLFVRKSALGVYGTGRRRVITADQPEWIPASEVTEWDMVAMPRNAPTRDIEGLSVMDSLARNQRWRDATEYVEDDGDLVMRYRNGGRVRSRIRNEIAIDERLLELAGLYLSQGSVLDKKKGVAFSFHERETHLQVLLLRLFTEIFGVAPNYRLHRNRATHGVQLCVYGPAARWLALTLPGNGLTKRIPGWMLWLPQAKQAALARGMWLGHGCLGHGFYTTASEAHAYAMAHLLSRLEIVSRIVKVRSWFNVSLNSYDGVERFKKATGLSIIWPMVPDRLRRHTQPAWRKDADFVYFPVRTIRAAAECTVYDLEVPSDSSFIAGRSAVHNCQLMGAVAREMGFRGAFLTQLCEPDTNLDCGAKYLASRLQWAAAKAAGTIGKPIVLASALAAWNGGTADNEPDTIADRNQDYAAAVLQIYDRIRLEGRQA